MKRVETINTKIAKREGRSLSQVFDVSRVSSRDILESVDFRDIEDPFGMLFEQQKAFLEDGSCKNAEILVENAVDLIGGEEWAHPIIRKTVYNLIGFEDSKSSKNIARFLFDIYRQLIQKKNRASIYVANALLGKYLEMKEFKAAEDLLLMVDEPEGKCRDYYVFNYYKGLVQGHGNNFEDSYLSLEKAFGYKRGRAVMAPAYFTSSLIVNKFPRKNYLVKFGCEHLLELTDAMRSGLYTRISRIIRNASDELSKHDLYRIAMVYCPLICFNNLVKRIYQFYGRDNKLDIQHITNLLVQIDFEEIVCLLSSVISLGRLKGYVSVNRGVIVFSRTDPFPIPIKNK